MSEPYEPTAKEGHASGRLCHGAEVADLAGKNHSKRGLAMCNGNAPHITICDPHGRRTNRRVERLGQPMNVAAYQTLMFVPTAEVAATV